MNTLLVLLPILIGSTILAVWMVSQVAIDIPRHYTCALAASQVALGSITLQTTISDDHYVPFGILTSFGLFMFATMWFVPKAPK